MAAVVQQTSGRASAREVAVWDPLVRLIHWSLALTILLNGTFIEEESKTHEWIGYVALGLVGLRLVWALIGPKHARFSAFPPSPARAIHHLRAMLSGDKTVHLSHNPLGALMVYNIWASVIAIGITGYMMTTITFFGVDWVEEAHEIVFNWLVFSVALHVAGVAFDTWRSGVNLVRAMINGRKTIPYGREVE
ncbi:cytochrome b/b6 domain-containing protein [Paracoccus fistulariae]|jgi:cytochrome b|uniref:Cytochrome b/b6 domain-containing protein n=1 Tax=Paracoccus fistulariae TaxID=658446 RepID=A0ABY7SQU9_9RHOB|nr:cytochrome b/b6 domain-containing protein [Paracoccus fistulariae]MDB6183238.1 cytochrome b/b6 domain-containing protein [Paracoccus fistulariae]WCR09229.1 cytochrome b/b6 domain-containing protein [Paracoccus fistulariae]